MAGVTNPHIGSTPEERRTLLDSMPSLEELSPTLASRPDFAGMNAAEVLKHLQDIPSRKQVTIKEIPIEENFSEGYDPTYDLASSVPCNPLTCHPMEEYFKLSELFKHFDDPSSEEIINQITLISADNISDKTLLLTQYQLFIRVAHADWVVLKPTLIEACLSGHQTLLLSLKSMCQVIQLQHSKAFTGNISILGQLVDQLKVQTNQSAKQLNMDRTFQEDLTRQLNSFTVSVAGLSEKIDNKTLELSRPSTKVMTPVHPPTTDSSSSPQTNLPGKIELIPQTTFKSSLLTATINEHGDLTLRPNAIRATPLCDIARMNMDIKVILTLLNQDHNLILGRLNTRVDYIKKFNSTPGAKERSAMLKEAFTGVPFKLDQWTRVPHPI